MFGGQQGKEPSLHLEVRRTALGRALLRLPGGDPLVRAGAVAYRATVKKVLEAYLTSREFQNRMNQAERELGISYRLVSGRFPLLLPSYYDLKMEAVFPSGEVLPIQLTVERGYEDIDGMTHIPLYERFASQIQSTTDKGLVLDCACGSGYGSAYLARWLKTPVLGIDLDPDVVSYARKRYISSVPGLSFRVGDAANLDFVPSGEARAIVSIETIEHVPDPDQALAHFSRVLQDDGVLCITSPDATDRPGTMFSPFHITEYTDQEFRSLLEQHFVEVDIDRQDNYLVASCRKPRR